jgi:hypothetical protein
MWPRYKHLIPDFPVLTVEITPDKEGNLSSADLRLTPHDTGTGRKAVQAVSLLIAPQNPSPTGA